ncbi:hypothetical protein ACIQZI_07230 [Peribacillus sp. NPDC096379]|uniref:hypothetical protein n=1 Tax=Peribacillus sp. NPDC096379 TaxID=3364393 RepID=UPI00381DCED9
MNKSLCHQDFASSMIVIDSDGIFIYKMDSLTVDRPISDMSEILNKDDENLSPCSSLNEGSISYSLDMLFTLYFMV